MAKKVKISDHRIDQSLHPPTNWLDDVDIRTPTERAVEYFKNNPKMKYFMDPISRNEFCIQNMINLN